MSTETTAIQSTTALQSTIDQMKHEAGAIVVTNAGEYAAVAVRLLRLRAVKKQVGYLLDPGIQSAQAHVNELREGKARYIRQLDEIDALTSSTAEEWKRREREAAEAEQRRINEQRRVDAARQAEEDRKRAEKQAEEDRKKREAEIKAAQKSGDIGKREAEKLKKQADEDTQRAKEQAAKDAEAAKANVQEVTVQPSVPKVAGIRAHVNWKFKIIEASKITRPYLSPDDVLIGRMVREKKDKAKAEAECPGIEVWSEDAI
jgi:hypothetical protein